MYIINKILYSDFLTNREKKIFTLRLNHKTLQQIGNEIGVTRERIRQIGERIKVKLEKNLSKEELKNYKNEYFRLKKSIPKLKK